MAGAVISLDDPAWAAARHAYGAAADVPDLLRSLALSPGPAANFRTEPWFSLWSSLCHQGYVYDASYLTVPHLVGIAVAADGPIDLSFLQLPAAVEVARLTGHGPALYGAHAGAYHDAIARLVDVVSLHRHRPWDQAWLLSAAAAQAVAKGRIGVAEALMELDDDWIARIVADERG